jgi:hypothetical protein
VGVTLVNRFPRVAQQGLLDMVDAVGPPPVAGKHDAHVHACQCGGVHGKHVAPQRVGIPRIWPRGGTGVTAFGTAMASLVAAIVFGLGMLTSRANSEERRTSGLRSSPGLVWLRSEASRRHLQGGDLTRNQFYPRRFRSASSSTCPSGRPTFLIGSNLRRTTPASFDYVAYAMNQGPRRRKH